MAIFIEYEGIKGNCTAEGYKDHLVATSVQFGVARSISMEPGNLANRESNRPTVSEIIINKKADNSATGLFKEAVTGSAGKTVKIKFVQTGADQVTEFMDYELTDCLVSSYSMSATGDEEPKETINLSFSKVMVNYNDFDSTNKSASPQRVGYDLATAKPL